MLASLRERLRASRATEAAARRSAAGMAGHLAETCLQLRRPTSIVHGYAGHLRQQHKPRPASPGQMLHRLTGEITRMDMPAERRHLPSAGDPAGTDRQPGLAMKVSFGIKAPQPPARPRPTRPPATVRDRRHPPASANHAQ